MDQRNEVYAGLGDGRWEVRRASAFWLLRSPDPADVERLLPLLHDPRAKVRQSVVVTLALAHAGAPEIVPHLLERALVDESLRVRRQTVSLIAWRLAHPDLAGFFAGLVERETDEALLRYARAGLSFCRARAERAPC
jgi:HEAT repeat protein